MLIKNCVVLVDEIDQRVRELGMTHDAIARRHQSFAASDFGSGDDHFWHDTTHL